MLILKNNKDLEKLKKLGFKPIYDQRTGNVVKYIKERFDNSFFYFIEFSKKRKNRLITIFKRVDIWQVDETDMRCFDFDTLYDLIKLDIIEKK